MFKIKIEENLYLTLMQECMANDLYELTIGNKEHLSKWFPWIWDVKSVDDSRAYIMSRLNLFAKGKTVYCGIIYQNKLVGVVDFVSIDKKNRKSDIGYWLDSRYQGEGIMSKAVSALINYGKECLSLEKFIILCDVENKKSCAIAKRLGFKQEGVFEKHLVINGKRRDFYNYALCV